LKSVPSNVRRFFQHWPATIGTAVVVIMTVVAVFAPAIAPRDPYEPSMNMFVPPSREYPFGTDDMGRDLLSRIVWGTRVSMTFAVSAAVISLFIGVVLGGISGYFGGVVDQVFSRFVELFLMVPRLFLVILLVAIFGNNVTIAVLVVALTIWPSNARLMRAQVLAIKDRAFVQASLGAGASSTHVLFHHVIPNGISAVVANFSLQMAQAVLLEASLSFLGLGDPNQVSWGQIIHHSQDYILSAWWMVVVPGAVLLLLLISLNLMGDGLAIVLNPRLRRSEAQR
jgi:peptide/nickel transport system permease protein